MTRRPSENSDPRWLALARKEIGTKEVPGKINAPNVVRYYIDAIKKPMADEVPWCAAFTNSMLVRAGKRSTNSLMARSFLTYGTRTSPRIGAIVVLSRGKPPSGHVGFYDGEANTGFIWLIGGNQSDAVTRARYPKSRILDYRWP